MPNAKHVVLAKTDGIVSLFSLTDKKEEKLMHFSGVKHIPMFAAAIRNGSLIVVAAGNYFNKETKINEAIYGVWHQGCLRTGICAPVQAITIDKAGKFVAMVNELQTVGVIDLNTYSLSTKSIWLKIKHEHNIDIVCSSDGNIIIVAKPSSITLMNWNGARLDLLNKCIPCSDIIKDIYLSYPETLIYTTSENQVKQIGIGQLFNNTERSKPAILFEAFFNGKVAIDRYAGNVAALWAKDKKATEMVRNQITIKKIEKTADSDFYLFLTMPSSKGQKYDYISQQGFKKYGYTYLRKVALRGDSVVAITADGKLCWWTIDLNDKKDHSNRDVLSKIIETITDEPKNTKKISIKATSTTPIPKIVFTSPGATSSDSVTKASRSQSDGVIPSPRKQLPSSSSSRDPSPSSREHKKTYEQKK